jgi:hypothetical protein
MNEMGNFDIDMDLSNINFGSLIYIQTDALYNLYKYLDLVKNPFYLIAGGSDYTIPPPHDVFTSGDDDDFFRLLNHPKIIHMFAQNCVIRHHKITSIPIGLDYHTMYRKSDQFNLWGEFCTPIEQEMLLLHLRDTAFPLKERKLLCYSNFHFTTSYINTDRKDAIAMIPKELVYYEPNYVDRMTSWKHQVHYPFVISPHGNGLDCHRTWEALALGCIPIVRTSPIDILYQDLPVLIVSNWSDITEKLLKITINRYMNTTFNLNKLSLSYWCDLIR